MDEETRKRAFENFTPRGNPPKEQQTSVEPLSLDKLDSMDAESLRNLIRTVGGAIWGYALMDDDQKAEAARLKLYNMGMSASEVHKVVPALDKWFDRTKGKAPQSIALEVQDTRMDKLPIDKLLRLASMLDEPVVIAPMPQKISDGS